MLVVGRRDDQVGNRTQVGQVEHTMVCGAVGTHQPGPVEAHDHLQLLQCHVVDYLVIGTQHEGRVDVAEGNHPLCGHAGGEGYRMCFGDAHIESPFRHLFHQVYHGTTGRHGRCHPHN